jgi:hypothetical protein
MEWELSLENIKRENSKASLGIVFKLALGEDLFLKLGYVASFFLLIS